VVLPATVAPLADGVAAVGVVNKYAREDHVHPLSASVPDGSITAPKLSGNQTGSAPIYGFRAWVTFDAAGTIISSGNIASVVRNSLGDFTITFATAMPDANYAWAPGINRDPNPYIMTVNSHPTVVPTAAAIRVVTYATAGGQVDVARTSLIFVG
jgi:hypothetical protein